jgi:hypothetical protein
MWEASWEATRDAVCLSGAEWEGWSANQSAVVWEVSSGEAWEVLLGEAMAKGLELSLEVASAESSEAVSGVELEAVSDAAYPWGPESEATWEASLEAS